MLTKYCSFRKIYFLQWLRLRVLMEYAFFTEIIYLYDFCFNVLWGTIYIFRLVFFFLFLFFFLSFFLCCVRKIVWPGPGPKFEPGMVHGLVSCRLSLVRLGPPRAWFFSVDLVRTCVIVTNKNIHICLSDIFDMFCHKNFHCI